VRAAKSRWSKRNATSFRISRKIKPKGSYRFGPPAASCAPVTGGPVCPLLASLTVPAAIPDSCLRVRPGLRSPSLAFARIKGVGHVPTVHGVRAMAEIAPDTVMWGPDLLSRRRLAAGQSGGHRLRCPARELRRTRSQARGQPRRAATGAAGLERPHRPARRRLRRGTLRGQAGDLQRRGAHRALRLRARTPPQDARVPGQAHLRDQVERAPASTSRAIGVAPASTRELCRAVLDALR
jgi:hypothetical protein